MEPGGFTLRSNCNQYQWYRRHLFPVAEDFTSIPVAKAKPKGQAVLHCLRWNNFNAHVNPVAHVKRVVVYE